MGVYANKKLEKKNKSETAVSSSEKQQANFSSLDFADSRPESITQMKLQEVVNNSAQVSQLKAFQEMADKSASFDQKDGLIQRRENQTGLPDKLKSGMENLSGFSMDDVKVHRNSDKPAQLNAHAYAQGSNIYLGPGQEQHLPHELGHVAQQKKGQVQPTSTEAGIPVNDDVHLEREADVLGAKAARSGAVSSTPIAAGASTGNSVSQMLWDMKSFQEATYGGIFVKRGTGVQEIDGLVDTYDGLQKDPKAKKDDKLYVLELIKDNILNWTSYHKDESRQADRIKAFNKFLVQDWINEKENVKKMTEDVQDVDGVAVPQDRVESDAVKRLKIKHEEGGDKLFKRLGAAVNAMVPQNGDTAKLEVAVKIPVPVAPGVTASIGGGITLEAGKDDNQVTTKAAVNMTAGVEFIKVLGVEGKIEGFIESKAGTAAEAVELMSYGLYQRARTGVTPAAMTNAIWGGGTGSLGFGAAEEKMAEKERRIFGPLKKEIAEVEVKKSEKKALRAQAQSEYQAIIDSKDLSPEAKSKIDAAIAKTQTLDAEIGKLENTIQGLYGKSPEVTTGGVAAVKATFGAGGAKMEGEISRTSGTKIGLAQIEQEKQSKFGEARERSEIGQGTGYFGNGKKKMGESAVGWEAKLAAELNPFGKAELAYKRDWSGPDDKREAKGELKGGVEVVMPISGSVAKTAAPYIIDMMARSRIFLAHLANNKDSDETSGQSMLASQAMSVGAIALSDVKSKLEAFEGVGVSDPKAPSESASGKVALKVEIGLENFNKLSLELGYVREMGVSIGGGMFEAKQEKVSRIFKGELP